MAPHLFPVLLFFVKTSFGPNIWMEERKWTLLRYKYLELALWLYCAHLDRRPPCIPPATNACARNDATNWRVCEGCACFWVGLCDKSLHISRVWDRKLSEDWSQATTKEKDTDRGRWGPSQAKVRPRSAEPPTDPTVAAAAAAWVHSAPPTSSWSQPCWSSPSQSAIVSQTFIHSGCSSSVCVFMVDFFNLVKCFCAFFQLNLCEFFVAQNSTLKCHCWTSSQTFLL